jgi:hypothetical protein
MHAKWCEAAKTRREGKKISTVAAINKQRRVWALQANTTVVERTVLFTYIAFH